MTSSPPEAFALDEGEYGHALDRGLSVSGEDRAYFARGRATHLEGLLRRLGERPRSILDFGCGSGGSSPLLREALGADSLLGVDASERLLQSARRLHASESVRFLSLGEWRPEASFDLAFCNGVFHHIAPPERKEALGKIFRALRPDGLFAFWENNPWSPAARLVMSRIPFDRGAVMVWPHAIQRAMRQEGFAVLRTDYCFFFPRFLGALRGFEPSLAGMPLGAQYQVLARRPR